MPLLYIAIYRPLEGNFKHWALFLDVSGSPYTFEAAGAHPSFTKEARIEHPESIDRYIRKILIADIADSDIADLIKYMETVAIDNETVEWNCQDYCLEAIEGMKDEFLIDENDEYYYEGLEEAKACFGPEI